MRRIIEALVDKGSFFEMGQLFGRPIITGFCRLDGWPVALMAGDPLFHGGAWTADACNKIIRFVDMAQTFHLPIVHLVDCPGFQVGLAAESSAVIRWGVRALSAINQTTVPWCSIVVRNCYGVGGLGHQPVSHLCVALCVAIGELGIAAAGRRHRGGLSGRDRRLARPAGEDGRDRGAAEPAALAVPDGGAVLGGGGYRPARDPAAAMRVRQHGRAAAHARRVAVYDAAIAGPGCILVM